MNLDIIKHFAQIQLTLSKSLQLLQGGLKTITLKGHFLFPITNQELHNMESCPICMECNTAEASKKLKCGHIYHKNCIIKWTSHIYNIYYL